MNLFFNPRTVAVVGISESPDNLARRIAENLQEFRFDGIVYFVGPKGGTALGRRIYKSVADIPDQVDLAVILVPARFVPDVLEECGQKSIRHAVIETAGFSELGQEGKTLEARMFEVVKKHGIRFIGPNCIGVMNLARGLAVPFTALKNVFVRGKISIISQSGGVGLDYLNVLASESLGLSKFASIGNKRNVDENDLLEYLIADDQTEIICMYLESISDGRRLMQIARRTSKPILLHKSNTGALASEIAHSHTASLSSDDAVVSAALKQAGIARFQEADTLVNYLKTLPLPRIKGNRLAVLSRSGGHAVIAADACEKAGFTLTRFPETFLREIEKHFRASVIRLTNPLDLGDLFDIDLYTRIVDQTLQLPDVDALVFLHTYIAAIEREPSRAFIKKIAELSFAHGKPVTTCVFTDGEEMSVLRKSLTHPVFTAPEDGVSALALVRDFRHEARPEPKLPDGAIDLRGISDILKRCVSERRPVMLDEGLQILKAAGLAVPAFRVVAHAEEAVAAAQELGFPVVMKLISTSASHKSDVGGIKLRLSTVEQIRAAHAELTAVANRISDPHARVLVQAMVEGGREIILGAKRDPTFGPVALVGLGGIFVEVFQDVAMRVVPFSATEADEMVKSLRAYPILAGVRGRPRLDIEAIQQGLFAVARLVSAFPEIESLDVNPLLVQAHGQGARAVDARFVLRSEAGV